MIDPEVPSMRPLLVVEASDVVLARGRTLFHLAGGLERVVPDVPEDEHDVRGWIMRFDEARQCFEERAADRVESAAGRLATAALDTTTADNALLFLSLPGAGR